MPEILQEMYGCDSGDTDREQFGGTVPPNNFFHFYNEN